MAAIDTTSADVGVPPSASPSRRSRACVVLSVGVLVVFAALIWNRRWMSDDGLIVLRTVRQLMAGHGAVFNIGERVEANTSTLWTYLLALPALLPGLSLNWASVVLGLLFSVAGLGFALDAARRLWRRPVVPFGALAVVALPPYWDFGTSGLETGLVVGWLGLSWWLLVGRLVTAPSGRAWPAAVVLGLAPLVRPDLALFGLVGLAALAVVGRHRGWRLAGLAAAAAAAPLAYEVFRAGYYGILLPGTALAKEAGAARWSEGLHYLADLVRTYALPVPLLAVVLAVVLLVARFRRALTPTTAVVLAVPWTAAALLTLYVTRVGGDFMHARMLLPALFCVLLPVMAVPLARRAIVPVAVVPLAVMTVWAVVCLLLLRPAYERIGPSGIANERLYYVEIVGRPNPVVAADFVAHPVAPEGVAELVDAPGPALALAEPGPDSLRWRLFPTAGGPRTIVWLNLGVTGELAALDVRVLDGVGLANPIAAHATGVPGERIGHDKALPRAWFLADSGATDLGEDDPSGVAAARAALACPATRDLLDSYRAPLTADRFWRNLTGSFARTAYRYDHDPFVAARCGPVQR